MVLPFPGLPRWEGYAINWLVPYILKSRDLSIPLSSKTDSLNVPVIVLHVMLACHCLYRERERDGSMTLSVQGERVGW